ncbi:MAG TPA: hypothetical protein VIV66_09805 [Pyrinomonadaceae bacterium]
MPFKIDPQPGEEIYLQREFRGSHSHVFAMAVSNQAVYVSAQKLALKRDPWYFKRVPLNEVEEVRVIKQRPIYGLLIGFLMVLFGGTSSFLMMWYALHPTPGATIYVSGWPFAILVGGIVIPFIARGRKTLIVRMRKGKFKWKPQFALDKKTRDLCSSIQDELIGACRKAGIQTAEL